MNQDLRIGLFGKGRLGGAIAQHLGDRIAWHCTREAPPHGDVDAVLECSSGDAVWLIMDSVETNSPLRTAPLAFSVEPRSSTLSSAISSPSRTSGAPSRSRSGRAEGAEILRSASMPASVLRLSSLPRALSSVSPQRPCATKGSDNFMCLSGRPPDNCSAIGNPLRPPRRVTRRL